MIWFVIVIYKIIMFYVLIKCGSNKLGPTTVVINKSQTHFNAETIAVERCQAEIEESVNHGWNSLYF
mgnify:FL=1